MESVNAEHFISLYLTLPLFERPRFWLAPRFLVLARLKLKKQR